MKKSKKRGVAKKVEAPKVLRVAMVGGAVRNTSAVIERYKAGWEIWGLNAIRPHWTTHIRWARWFNLHRWAHLVRDWSAGLRSEIDFAQANPNVPFYVLDAWRKGTLPNARIFPRETLEALPFGRYHAGSFDWMVAYAIHLGAKEISIHGVTLSLDSPRDEPISARPCLEYWLGVAAGRNIELTIGADSDLFCQYHLVRSRSVYGYDDVKLVENRP